MPETYSVTNPASFSTSTLFQPKRRRQTRRDRSLRYFQTIALSVMLTLLLALWIGGHARVTVEGYQLARLRSELKDVQQYNRVLTAREALLAQPGRIDATVAEMQMVRLTPSQTLFLPGSASRISSPAAKRFTSIALAPGD